MKLNKNDILSALEIQKKDIAYISNESFKKNDIIDKISNFKVTTKHNNHSIDNSCKEMNVNLANPSNTIRFESMWKTRSDMKDISRKFLIESTILENSQPNAFRLDLGSLVLDKTHAKLSMKRSGEIARVELMYPNANGKITVKITLDDVDDNIYEISLEDEDYIGNFGASILTKLDDMIQSKNKIGVGEYNAEYYSGGNSAGVTGFSPKWESVSCIGKSRDLHNMFNLMTIVEADDDEDYIELSDFDFNEIDSGDVNSESFDESDFSIDAGGMDFGSDIDMNAFDDSSTDNVHNSDNDFSIEKDVTYLTFREKNDWLNSSIDAMQKLVANSVANKMQEGKGVILTSDEILNGSTGIKNDANSEVIDKFLKVYPSLDSIEFREDDLTRVEKKLSLNDGQFDSWLQSEIPGMRGDSDVDDTLNNEMFDTFDEMGGEDKESFSGIGEFDDFIDDNTSDDGGIDEMFNMISNETEDDDDDEDELLRKKVESEIDIKETDEFPNI